MVSVHALRDVRECQSALCCSFVLAKVSFVVKSIIVYSHHQVSLLPDCLALEVLLHFRTRMSFLLGSTDLQPRGRHFNACRPKIILVGQWQSVLHLEAIRLPGGNSISRRAGIPPCTHQLEWFP